MKGDITRRLEEPAEVTARLASTTSDRLGQEIATYSTAIKMMRQNFFSGDVLPDGVQDGERDYDTLAARVDAGVPSCA